MILFVSDTHAEDILPIRKTFIRVRKVMDTIYKTSKGRHLSSSASVYVQEWHYLLKVRIFYPWVVLLCCANVISVYKAY